MKYKIGDKVIYGYNSKDIFEIIATKEDGLKNFELKNGFDYLVQKIYDDKTNTRVKGEKSIAVIEDNIWFPLS